ncbi:MAG: superoxide dismutase [Alistipes sp.]|jgi:Fe-Mn family superoxide dismutase|nr:superoxide dismutase [Alistipes sp.]
MTIIDQPRAPFVMPELPYDRAALAPHIGAETIDYHYGKHLRAYVDNLNKLVADTQMADQSLEEIVRGGAGAIFNNAAQAWNHTLYFLQLSPTPLRRPSGGLSAAIDRDFGSFDAFVEQFTKAALGLFGSGWVWLASDADGKLTIDAMPNAGNPLTEGLTPLMVVDVWEHAYYIDHRNARAEAVKAFWNVLDWRVAEERYGL